jgi:hypothetical protein
MSTPLEALPGKLGLNIRATCGSPVVAVPEAVPLATVKLVLAGIQLSVVD